MLISAPESAARRQLEAHVAGGGLLHGSPTRNITRLRAASTDSLHVDTRTAEKIVDPRIICATDDVDLAIFYACVYRPVCDAQIRRGAAILPQRNEQGDVVDRKYFLSDRGKQLVAESETACIRAAAYLLEQALLEYVKRFCEWRSYEDLDHIGEVAVQASMLSVDVYDLAAPDSNATIHGFYERDNTPAETPAL